MKHGLSPGTYFIEGDYLYKQVEPQPIPTADLGDEDYEGPVQYFVEGGILRTPARYGSFPAPSKYKPGDQLVALEEWAETKQDTPPYSSAGVRLISQLLPWYVQKCKDKGWLRSPSTMPLDISGATVYTVGETEGVEEIERSENGYCTTKSCDCKEVYGKGDGKCLWPSPKKWYWKIKLEVSDG
ncbi:hypothetical protein KAR91_66860 [Candidatus Pacearchaeota archaeon]|nr:hypothetical protein [Candidatus Pacearchaeota archaeon]